MAGSFIGRVTKAAVGRRRGRYLPHLVAAIVALGGVMAALESGRAQACAALGQSENALKYLHIAAELGWTAVNMVEQTPEFRILLETPEWATLMAQIWRNQEGQLFE